MERVNNSETHRGLQGKNDPVRVPPNISCLTLKLAVIVLYYKGGNGSPRI